MTRMIRRISHAVCLLALLAPVSGLSQDVDCSDPVTQMEMTYCAEQDWQAADAELNAAYGRAMAAMKQQIDNANKTATDLQPIITPLTESVAKADEAAKKVPEDKELASALAALKTQLDKKNAAMAAAKKVAADQTAAMQKATTDEAAVTKAVQEATQQWVS